MNAQSKEMDELVVTQPENTEDAQIDMASANRRRRLVVNLLRERARERRHGRCATDGGDDGDGALRAAGAGAGASTGGRLALVASTTRGSLASNVRTGKLNARCGRRAGRVR